MENWSFDFTPEKLAQCSARNTDPTALFDALSAVLPRYEINTVDRVAAFLAQCGHESADFTVLHENLNYSAKGLHATWPTRFISEDAAVPYNRNPEAIANKVYSSRLGNGDEASGDGWHGHQLSVGTHIPDRTGGRTYGRATFGGYAQNDRLVPAA